MAWPTTDDPRTQIITLRLTEGEESVLLTDAAAQKMNRSEYVRSCVVRCHEADARRAAKDKGASKR